MELVDPSRFPPNFAMLRFVAENCGSGLAPIPARFGGLVLEAVRRASSGEPAHPGDGDALAKANGLLDFLAFHQVDAGVLPALASRASNPTRVIAALREAYAGVDLVAASMPVDVWGALADAVTAADLPEAAYAVAPGRWRQGGIVRLEGRYLRFVGLDDARPQLRFPAPLGPVDTSVDFAGLRARRHPFFFHEMNQGSVFTRGGDAAAWNDFAWGHLEAVLRAFPDELVVAGGFVTALLCPNTRFTKTLDADLFVHGVTAERATFIVAEIARLFEPTVAEKTRNAITMARRDQTMPFQPVLRLHGTREDVLRAFDLAPCQVLLAYDAGEQRLVPWGTEAFCVAVRHGVVWPDFRMPPSAARLMKCAMKGFRLVVPGLRRALLKQQQLLPRMCEAEGRCGGLDVLLNAEWATNERAPRSRLNLFGVANAQLQLNPAFGWAQSWTHGSLVGDLNAVATQSFDPDKYWAIPNPVLYWVTHMTTPVELPNSYADNVMLLLYRVRSMAPDLRVDAVVASDWSVVAPPSLDAARAAMRALYAGVPCVV